MQKINRKAFTLIELLAVIVILALIMGIALFSMSGVPRLMLKAGILKEY